MSTLVARTLVTVAVCASATVAGAQTAAPTPLTLDAAFAQALAANPDVAAARLRRNIDLSGVRLAGERPNPDAHFELSKETPTTATGIALPIELGGKRGRRIAVADAAVQAGDAETAQAIVDVRTAVRRAYFARVVAEARFAILDELRQFAARGRDAAQARLDVGSAPRLELLQAQLALSASDIDLAAAQAAIESARIQLNALLGMPLDADPPLATTFDTPPGLIGAPARERAQTANAELAVLDSQIAEARARLSLAQALRVPDVTPDVTVTHGAEPEFLWGWRVAASATIPLFTTHRAAAQVEDATLAQLTARRAALLARIVGDVTAASATADAQRRAYLRYRDDILPQAQEVEAMAEDSYRSGQTGIAALLQALETSRQVRLQYLQTASDLQTALSDLERAIGAPVP